MVGPSWTAGNCESNEGFQSLMAASGGILRDPRRWLWPTYPFLEALASDRDRDSRELWLGYLFGLESSNLPARSITCQ